jgi:hypothetical protein
LLKRRRVNIGAGRKRQYVNQASQEKPVVFRVYPFSSVVGYT